MVPVHAAFSTSHPLFYDVPGRTQAVNAALFRPDEGRDWTSWRSGSDRHWVHWLAPEATLPEQGWKIHISTTPSGGEEMLRDVSAFCHDRGVPFKHLRDMSVLAASVSKDADRASAGKFITMYPASDEALHSYLVMLDHLVGGRRGPYVLSDLRWRAGPLYVRYGAFTKQTVVSGGRAVPAIKNLDTGGLVPDLRLPKFQIPQWVKPPQFLVNQIDELARENAPAELPSILEVLHHSNAGGVYRAELDGKQVVLKEARPHTGWTPDGRDAIDRLGDEERILRALPDEVSAPRPVALLTLHDHRFLVLDFVGGLSLVNEVASRNPLSNASSSPSDYASYRDWALRIGTMLRTQVAALHASGVTHGDLHPRNILVDETGAITLLDFEMSLPTDSGRAPAIGVAGFAASSGLRPAMRDIYAIACIELFLFLPITPLLRLHNSKATELLRAAGEHFGLTDGWVARLARELEMDPVLTAVADSTGQQVSNVRVHDIARALIVDSESDRFDRLWPGDPQQFNEGRYSLGFGALGVAAALENAGATTTESQRLWLRDAVRFRATNDEPVGLMNGLSGAVWGCNAIRMPGLASEVLNEIERSDWEALDSTLYSGLPGVALTILANSDGFPHRIEIVREMFRVLSERLESGRPPSRVATDAGGLFGGASGSALLALRLYDWEKDPALLEFAARALSYDAASLSERPDGSLHVNEGWRILPYLGYGSAGIGLVLAEYLALTKGNPEQVAIMEGIVRAASAPFTVQSGLLHGRAGIIYFLDRARQLGHATEASDSALERHVAALQLHALPSAEGTRFAGNGLLRASCDLASGAAGVLAVLARRSGQARALGPLSFLEPTASAVSGPTRTWQGR